MLAAPYSANRHFCHPITYNLPPAWAHSVGDAPGLYRFCASACKQAAGRKSLSSSLGGPSRGMWFSTGNIAHNMLSKRQVLCQAESTCTAEERGRRRECRGGLQAARGAKTKSCSAALSGRHPEISGASQSSRRPSRKGETQYRHRWRSETGGSKVGFQLGRFLGSPRSPCRAPTASITAPSRDGISISMGFGVARTATPPAAITPRAPGARQRLVPSKGGVKPHLQTGRSNPELRERTHKAASLRQAQGKRVPPTQKVR